MSLHCPTLVPLNSEPSLTLPLVLIGAPITESGIKYTCDYCSADISHTVRIRCAQLDLNHPSTHAVSSPPNAASNEGPVPTCEEFDLCGSCFCAGRETGRHKRWHDYRVVVGGTLFVHDTPIT